MAQRRALSSIGKILLVFALVTGAAYGEGVTHLLNPSDTLADFTHCHGYGCMGMFRIALSGKDWQALTHELRNHSVSAETERRAIARTIAAFESFAGQLTGTGVDRGRARFFETDPKQMDCIDETVNTTTVLYLLEQNALLSHHKLGMPARRGYIIDGLWPHNTAVIIERHSGAAYAVDSWFHDNGIEPEIVPLETWQAGWKPPMRDNKAK